MRIFRNFFCHLKWKEQIYELGETEVWPSESSFMQNLRVVLEKELVNIRELTDFESGLQYALLRQLELVRAQYEYFGNPYYNDLGDHFEFPALMEIEDTIEKLTDQLIATCS